MVLRGSELSGEVAYKVAQGNWGGGVDGIVLYLGCGYMRVYNCQNSWNFIL